MSDIYNLEPFTSGKVIIHTTYGDIEVELWSKETPKACRNFIQLSLEGYYDNVIFHRVVPDFIVQTGDPTGTGECGESIYGKPFADEFSQRLKFSRRGLVGMANTGRNSNTSQFFITLDKAPELQNKNTLFGRIVGDTVFNAIRIGQVETDDKERPLYPPKITSIEIISNPFDDIVPRIAAEERRAAEENARKQVEAEEAKTAKKKVKRNKGLLSFGDEEVETEEVFKPKAKSVHDAPDVDARLSKKVNDEDLKRSQAKADVDDRLASLKRKVQSGSKEERDKSAVSELADRVRRDLEADKAEKERLKKQKTTDLPAEQLSKAEKQQAEIDKIQNEIKSISKRPAESEHSQSMKRAKQSTALDDELAQYKARSRALQIKKVSKKSEGDDTAAILAAFEAKLSSNVEDTAVTGSKEEDDAEPCLLHGVRNCLSCQDTFGVEDKQDYTDWMAHSLKFDKARLGRDHLEKLDQYEVIDPRERTKEVLDGERRKKASHKSRDVGEAFKPRSQDRHRDDTRRGNGHGSDRHSGRDRRDRT